jgi:hypothetical protein
MSLVRASQQWRPPDRIGTRALVRFMMPARWFAAASLALACMAPLGAAHADDAELRVLRQQVEELKDTVRQLQERVNALEKNDSASWIPAMPAPAPAVAPAVAPAAAVASPASAAGPVQTDPAPKQANAAAKPSTDDKVVILRTSWRRISSGMTQADVKDTLGPPTREMLINGKAVWYYYYAGVGAGSVFFNRDGRISSSQSPNLGWGF